MLPRGGRGVSSRWEQAGTPRGHSAVFCRARADEYPPDTFYDAQCGYAEASGYRVNPCCREMYASPRDTSENSLFSVAPVELNDQAREDLASEQALLLQMIRSQGNETYSVPDSHSPYLPLRTSGPAGVPDQRIACGGSREEPPFGSLGAPVSCKDFHFPSSARATNNSSGLPLSPASGVLRSPPRLDAASSRGSVPARPPAAGTSRSLLGVERGCAGLVSDAERVEFYFPGRDSEELEKSEAFVSFEETDCERLGLGAPPPREHCGDTRRGGFSPREKREAGEEGSDEASWARTSPSEKWTDSPSMPRRPGGTHAQEAGDRPRGEAPAHPNVSWTRGPESEMRRGVATPETVEPWRRGAPTLRGPLGDHQKAREKRDCRGRPGGSEARPARSGVSWATQGKTERPAFDDEEGPSAESGTGNEQDGEAREDGDLVYLQNMASVATRMALPRNKRLSPEDFQLLRVIGKGSYGKVMLVQFHQDGGVYAMKMLRKEAVVRRNQVEHTRTERDVLAWVSHPFIVQMHYAFQTRKKLYFVLEYCPGGELFFHLSRAGRFKEYAACFYAAEVLLALEHLHKYNVVYRDLKPENVLLDEHGHVRLTDFGLSKEGVEDNCSARSLCGTPEYLAPEILSQQGHGKAVDWWSLGALIYEMLTGLPPFYTGDRERLFENIRSSELQYPSYMSRAAVHLLRGLFQRDPNRRLGGGPGDAEEIKRHPFFGRIDWEALQAKRMRPPFRPRLQSPTDVQYFDNEFVKLPVINSEVQESPIGVAAGEPEATPRAFWPSGAGADPGAEACVQPPDVRAASPSPASSLTPAAPPSLPGAAASEPGAGAANDEACAASGDPRRVPERGTFPAGAGVGCERPQGSPEVPAMWPSGELQKPFAANGARVEEAKTEPLRPGDQYPPGAYGQGVHPNMLAPPPDDESDDSMFEGFTYDERDTSALGEAAAAMSW
ncbi:AGC kinase [Toxoplasma gondii RUB]|uniref:AGC kinase n=1 Tax=Toxoplasma gondii RUB TaxID=935652 RepID=A0A086LQL7_TOXGO|nr:AGC kinase [Toxoplasma gondii RUB]